MEPTSTSDVDSDRLWPEQAPGTTVLQLDALFAALAVGVWAHAVAQRGFAKGSLLVAWLAVHTAAFEHTSLFLGGTHCHATSPRLWGITPCSSVNSVLFYVPWIYTSVEAARKLRLGPVAFAVCAGLLQFGFGTVYEMQGPINHFWKWPDEAGVIASSFEHLSAWEGYPQLSFLRDAQANGEVATIDGSGVFRVSSHAGTALTERAFGFPVMAPYFHFAYGWAWAMGLLLATKLENVLGGGGSKSPGAPFSLLAWVVSGLHVPLLFLIPIRATMEPCKLLGLPYAYGILVSLGLAVVALGLLRRKSAPKETASATAPTSSEGDVLLFGISLAMQVFFVTWPWRSETSTPTGLVALVTAVSTLHLVAQWHCCCRPVPAPQSRRFPIRV